MTLAVQAFLRDRSLADLLDAHGVNHRASDRDPCVFTLNYDQIRVRDDDALACQCRGLVLRAASPVVSAMEPVGETRILARPFDRFFNLGQSSSPSGPTSEASRWASTPLHLPKRRERKPDPVAEAAAIAKRARRAAKRAEDERRTAEGRVHLWVRLRPRRAFWDWCEWRIRNGEWHVRNGSAIGEPRWRIRSRERRALPGMERPWFARYQERLRLHTIIRHIGFGRARAMLMRGVL